MKLFFPNGDHASVDLIEGVLLVGSSPASQIVLSAAGVAPKHCELRTEGERTTIGAVAVGASVKLNGVEVTDFVLIKGGDLLMIAGVAARVLAIDRRPARASVPIVARPRALPERVANKVASEPESSDDNRTRVRMTLPKFILRGVSGATFGKVYSVHAGLTIGRAADCDISIPSEEISRHHARLRIVPDGVMVEDIGSANGTYVNDQRVAGPTLLRPGGELRMDVVRFLLIAPGKETEDLSAAATARGAVATSGPSVSTLVWIGVGLVVLVVIAIYALNFGFRL